MTEIKDVHKQIELSEDEKNALRAIENPVIWATEMLSDPDNPNKNFSSRWYQDEVLKWQPVFMTDEKGQRILTQRIKCYRMGRRVGKCLDPSTRIVQEDGAILTVKEMFDKQKGSCISIDENFKTHMTNDIFIFENGIKDIYRLKTRSGREIDVTNNHPFLTLDGWIELKDLKVGDSIICPSKMNVKPKRNIDNRLVKLIAYLLGDGGLTTGKVNFFNEDKNIQNDFIDSCTYFDGVNVNIEKYKDKCTRMNAVTHIGGRNPILKFLRKHGIDKQGSHDKFIPQIIYRLCQNQISLFLSRLFATDGWASSSNTNDRANYQIGYCSVSKSLIYGIQHLLLRLGINSFIRVKNTKLNDKKFSSYVLEIRDKKNILNFLDSIGIYSKEKQCNKLRSFIIKRDDRDAGYFDLVPKSVCKKFRIVDKNCGIRTKYDVSKKKLFKWADKCNNIYLKNLCTSDTFFDEVVSIECVNTGMTYDLTVNKYHNFIANDIFVHNTIILAVEALWKACVNYNFKILYIAPFESQCNIFFNMLEKLLTNSSIQTDRFVRKPFICQFKNGSMITAHTANVRSSRKGSTIRGAEGDLIIIDEMDHGIDEVINEVVMPIYFGNDRATIIGASTPSGRRGIFYLWSEKKSEKELGIKSFHYSSKVSPRWTLQSEKMAKKQMTRDQYVHEIDADFGEELQGVFKHKDLDFIMAKYEYDKVKYDRVNNYYIMGVDWNEKFGTCIVIVEKNKKSGKYKIFLSEIVPKQEFTQLQGLDKIKKLHRKYPCDFLYVDKGYGSTNIELLKKEGLINRTSKFDKITKDIDYGGTIEIRDPVTGKKDKKPAKSFLVDNTVLVMESKNITIPENEDSEYGIIGQMRNFRVKKISSAGHPVYTGEYKGEDNDHSFNALMLALAGFTLEYGEINKYESSVGVAKVKATNLFAGSGYCARENVESKNVNNFRNILRRTTPNYKSGSKSYIHKNKTIFVSAKERAMKEAIKHRNKRFGFGGRENI